jgi:hypothetical protein
LIFCQCEMLLNLPQPHSLSLSLSHTHTPSGLVLVAFFFFFFSSFFAPVADFLLTLALLPFCLCGQALRSLVWPLFSATGGKVCVCVYEREKEREEVVWGLPLRWLVATYTLNTKPETRNPKP